MNDEGGNSINKFGDRRVVGSASFKKSMTGYKSPNSKGSRLHSKTATSFVHKRTKIDSVPAIDLESQLRQMEKDAANGKLKDGFESVNLKRRK